MAEFKSDNPQGIWVKRKGLLRFAWIGVLAAFTIATLSVYYGYASDERLPSFYLETIEGDDSIGSAIQLDGSYIGRLGNRPMKVDAEGTEYTDANSVGRLFILPFSKTYTASTAALIKAHRSFMRGKEYGTIDQTDDKLVYVELVRKHNEAKVKLSVLNKKTEESADYTWEAGSWQPREQVYLADLQIEGERVHLLIERATNTRTNEKIDPQLMDHIFDLSTGKLKETREIKLPVRAGYDVSVTGNRGSGEDSMYAILFASRESVTGKAAGGDLSTPTASEKPPIIKYEPFIYKYADGSLQPLDLNIPDNMAHTTYYVDGDKLYAVTIASNTNSWSSKSFDITETNLSSQSQTAAYTLHASDLGGKELYTPRFSDGKLYFVVPGVQVKGAMGKASTKVAVVEASSGKTVYQGQVAYDGPSSKAASELKDTVLLNLELRS
ncbi:hypothetical protein [Cohnella hashimotonis]|uniref:DUF4179 domain-containing protein n=1 Tax=Cohnella hashimotonis TaxID=2826895 RepID=A0ABT6TI98_9BACL|nr:hypothetical protein [Cohnella hashimotonis]MDI4646028.1 hypothetical protein [Cohnella hashimotonis]